MHFFGTESISWLLLREYRLATLSETVAIIINILMGDIRFIPDRRQLSRIAVSIKQYLFRNRQWRLDYNAFIYLMDCISKDPQAPTPYKIPYGLAIDATNNTREKLHQIGVKGSYDRLQTKQAICCGMMKLDEYGNLRNRNLFNKILPHTQNRSRKKWIDQCVSYLKDYTEGKSDAMFHKYEDLQRDS